MSVRVLARDYDQHTEWCISKAQEYKVPCTTGAAYLSQMSFCDHGNVHFEACDENREQWSDMIRSITRYLFV